LVSSTGDTLPACTRLVTASLTSAVSAAASAASVCRCCAANTSTKRCATSDTKTAKKALKRSFKKLGRLRKLLKASKTIPSQAELLSTVDGLRDDVRALRATLACPIPATVAP
jgi:hypothetical protein